LLYERTIPKNFINIMKERLKNIESQNLRGISSINIDFITTCSKREINELFDSHNMNLWCVPELKMKNNKTFNGIPKLLKWFEEAGFGVDFFYEHLHEKFGKIVLNIQ
jgi:hypothetical protein